MVKRHSVLIGIHTFDLSDRVRLRDELETVLATARKLRVLDEDITLESLVASNLLPPALIARIRPPSLDHHASRPSAMAAALVYAAVVAFVVSIELSEAKPPDARWQKGAAYAQSMITLASGYLFAMTEHRNSTARRGAEGRREIGASTRKRAQRAAEPLKGTMSRDAAAAKIAEEIGRAPSSVRRMLSELFPGEAWKAKD